MRDGLLAVCTLALVACSGDLEGDGVTPFDLAGDMDDAQGCGADAPCPAGLDCITGICVVPCASAEDCPAGICYPLPNQAHGWCGPSSGNGGGGGGAPPPGDPGAGNPSDPPSADPGDDDDDPGALPDKPPGPGDDAPPDDGQDPPSDPPPPDTPPPADDGPGTDEPPPPDAPPPNTPPPAPENCQMPWADGEMELGRFMKDVSWRGAIDESGQQVDIDLEQVYCDQSYDTITVIVGAGWCSACPDYERAIAPQANGIAANNGLVLWLQTEDNSYNPASSAVAAQIVNRYVGNAPGLRVGDGETLPRPNVFAGSPIVPSYPSGFIVRVSDMRIIATQAAANGILQFDRIAADPNRLWVGNANCGAGEEEPHEPNDSAYEPATIGAGTFRGGVCGSDMDFYYVDVQGQWRFDLQFRHGTGDIDTYVWDPATNAPLVRGGEKVGSDSGNDNESFTHSGPALVVVYGFRMATSPYELTVTQL